VQDVAVTILARGHISLPGVRGARFDPSRPTEPAGYTCAVTGSGYGEADTGCQVKEGRVVSQGIKPGKQLQAGTKVPPVVPRGARKPSGG
jgi:hypothetical protein